MTPFTSADVVAQVRALAQERPDYVYQRPLGNPETECSYLTGADGQGCIMGQALTRLGVSIEALSTIEGENVMAALPRLAVRTTPSDGWWLRAVQEQQDHGSTWGQAVRRADVQAATRAVTP